MSYIGSACGMCAGRGKVFGNPCPRCRRFESLAGMDPIAARSLMATPLQPLSYLVVPRDPQPAPIVRSEVEILRERNAALEARLAALVAAHVPDAAQPTPAAGIRHALTAWPGSGGVDQRTGMPSALVRGLR